MPVLPHRVVPGHEPAGDDMFGLDLIMGDGASAYFNQPTMTQKERAEWRKELLEREKRRIPCGFAPPQD